MIEDRHLGGRRFPLAVAAVWLLCSVVLLIVARKLVLGFDFRDPDDALRLLQVRDWMAGQSWFDVTQHRINPPVGGPMHWSRLIDVPIAVLIWLMTPLAGLAGAERLVLAVYPLMVLGLLFGLAGGIVRQLAGAVAGLFAVLLLAVAIPILFQLAPMRIDHHGWQIVMAAFALRAALLPSPLKSGVATGVAVTLWVAISSEALPYAALFGSLYGLKYIRHSEEWPRLSAYLLTFPLASTLVLLGTHGWAGSRLFYCDAMSPTFLIPLWLAAALVLALKGLLPDRILLNRLAITGLAGTGALIAAVLTGGECLKGPFETLDPYVYHYWYLHIREGLPIWHQASGTVVMIVTGPLLGLTGYLLAIRAHWGAAKAALWMEMLFLSIGAFVLSLLVLRAMSVAHLFAIPGNAWLVLQAVRRARAVERTGLRIVATVAVMLLFPVLPTAVMAKGLALAGKDEPEKSEAENRKEAACLSRGGLRPLAALPTSTLFAPLDIGPFLLLRTHHSVIATNHHRNQRAMAKVLRAFMSPPEKARGIIASTPADYVLFCPDWNEIELYNRDSPKGLAARLQSGRPPAWLKPVPMPAGTTIRVYRFVRQAG